MGDQKTRIVEKMDWLKGESDLEERMDSVIPSFTHAFFSLDTYDLPNLPKYA